MQLDVNISACPEELRSGLAEVSAAFPGRLAGGALRVRFEKGGEGPAAVSGPDGAVLVRYRRPIEAFRALGRLLGAEDPAACRFTETPRFDTLGVMFDVSRNGVLTPETVKALLRHCALMGLNLAMLYTEDTYEVPGEPFFGYLRGRYTQAELKALDDYAHALGIELVPCIQTLGHMSQVLQWPAYRDYKDTDSILLAEDEQAYALIERMVDAAAAPLRSRRIFAGMDEANGIGTGRYRELHGERRPFDILNAHLQRVRDICARRGLRLMICSDMYFRLGSARGDYYDKDSAVPPEVAAGIPRDVDLLYWDYTHLESGSYEGGIDRHRALGLEPVMAGAAFTWNHFWTALPFSMRATDACMRACKSKGLRQFILTTWGDDGAECDIFSALPIMQLSAEHAYADSVDEGLLRANFRGSCGADFDDWMRAAELDSVPCLADPGRSYNNVSKWLLWQDPLLSLMDPYLNGTSLREHYAGLAEALFTAAGKPGISGRLRFPAHIARALALKCDLRRNLAAAYSAGDRARLKEIADGDLSALRSAVRDLWRHHRGMWLDAHKPFGLEVIEGRYGGLLARLESLQDRLSAFCAGGLDSIPELEEELLAPAKVESGDLPWANYDRLFTPSALK